LHLICSLRFLFDGDVKRGLFPPRQPGASVQKPPAAVVPPVKLVLELLNARSWLAGKQATLHVAVKEESGANISGASVSAEN